MLIVDRSVDIPSSSRSQGDGSLEHFIIGDRVDSSLKGAIDSIHDMPDDISVNHRVTKVMSRFYSLVRRLKLPADIDLNAIAVDHLNCPHGPIPFQSTSHVPPPTPWLLGYSWSSGNVSTEAVFSRLHRIQDSDG